jgi:glycosyltransferase involved in cell wall biosynthesis
MRVLIVAPRHPEPPLRGDQRRVLNLAGALRQHADVHLLAFGTGPALRFADVTSRQVPVTVRGRVGGNVRRPRPDLPAQVRIYLDRRMHDAVERTIDELRPDVVQLTLARMGEYLPEAGPHRHVDLVDSLSLNVRTRASASTGPARLALALEARAMARYEAELAARADSVSVVSSADAREVGLARAVVVPNGVDLEDFAFKDPVDRPARLVFFGNLGYFHNVAPARFVADEVLPRVRASVPGVELVLAGARPAAGVRELADRRGVVVLGEVPAMAPVLHTAAVAVLPMFSGSGMKNKVLEAMACGTPVVANQLGVEGIAGLRPVQDHLRGEDADEMAAACVELLEDPGRRQTVARAARRHVEEHCTWDAVAARFVDLYRGRAA